MGLFDRLGGRPAPEAQGQQISENDMRQEIGRISSNPQGYLQNLGFKIPPGMTDARQITRYLLESGQVGGQRLQQVMRLFHR